VAVLYWESRLIWRFSLFSCLNTWGFDRLLFPTISVVFRRCPVLKWRWCSLSEAASWHNTNSMGFTLYHWGYGRWEWPSHEQVDLESYTSEPWEQLCLLQCTGNGIFICFSLELDTNPFWFWDASNCTQPGTDHFMMVKYCQLFPCCMLGKR
jgi:hypothetical protein